MGKIKKSLGRKKNSNKIKMTAEDYVVDIGVIIILIIFSLFSLYPVWYVFVGSFTDTLELTMNPGFLLWPKKMVWGAYRQLMDNRMFLRSYGNTLKILAMGIPIQVIAPLIYGYFMSCERMYWKKLIVLLVTITMFLDGGMIPNYLNIRDLGLIDTYWALVIPGCLSVGNAMLVRASIAAIPDSLKDAAYIDGANDFQVIFKVILPLIKATVAVLVLYNCVDLWNAWFNAAIYLQDSNKMPLQNILRVYLTAGKAFGEVSKDEEDVAEALKYASIVVSTVPILCVYPFLQKYFAKGALLGAVKG